ncbi:MAG: hypothetical protein AABZ78_04430, partial [Chloroflexota bacterium]
KLELRKTRLRHCEERSLRRSNLMARPRLLSAPRSALAMTEWLNSYKRGIKAHEGSFVTFVSLSLCD